MNEIEAIEKITAIMRECDSGFEKTGGSTRHYVRDWFLPLLRRNGLELVQVSFIQKIKDAVTFEDESSAKKSHYGLPQEVLIQLEELLRGDRFQ